MDYRGGKLRNSVFRHSDLCLTLELQRRFKLRRSLGSDKSGTCQAKRMCYPSFQQSKKRQWQRNAQLGKVLFITSEFFHLYFNLPHKQGSAFWFLLPYAPPDTQGKSCQNLITSMSPLHFIPFSILCFLNPPPWHRSGSIRHNLACSLLAFFPFPISALPFHQLLWHLRAMHSIWRAGTGQSMSGAIATVQMTELEVLAQPCLSILMRLNQRCNSLGSFALLLSFSSGILTNPSIPLLPTSSSCSRESESRTDEATVLPFCLVTQMHY